MKRIRLGPNPWIAMLVIALLTYPTHAAADKQKKFVTGPNQERVAVTAERQLVYGLSLFDGGQYQTTFCPKSVNTIYMVAGFDNVVTFRSTEVYFWPLTKEYMANWMELNQNLTGSLEVRRGNRVIKTISPTKFAFIYPEGGNKATMVQTGAAAVTASQNYDAQVEAYYEQMSDYLRSEEEYRRLVKNYLKNPKSFKGSLPPAPREPQPPGTYVSPPDDGFILNLLPGNYRILFKDSEGKPVSGSEKALVVFPALAKGVGYEIIPEDKWTAPLKSNGPGDNLFLRNGQVIYLKPFETRQYNNHHFLKLSQLNKPSSGRGVEDRKVWTPIYPIKGQPIMTVLKNGKPVQQVKETPYIVKQRPGYALGYDILEYSPQRFPGEKPTFSAYRIKLPSGNGRFELRLQDANGLIIKGSQRKIYNIPEPSRLIFLAAVLPLGIGIIVKIRRRWVQGCQTGAGPSAILD